MTYPTNDSLNSLIHVVQAVEETLVRMLKILVRLDGVGRGGAFVESMTFSRRVVGSTPALAAT